MSEEWSKIEAGNSWDPDSQEEITGVLVSLEEDVGKYNSTAARLKVEGEINDVTVWCNSVLEDKIKKVPLGSLVKIEYLGNVESKQYGKPYRNYDVYFRENPMKKVESGVNEIPF